MAQFGKFNKGYRQLCLAVMLTSAILFALHASAGSAGALSSLSQGDQEAERLRTSNATVPLFFSGALNYVQRGDWEQPEILLMVENEEWEPSLDIIVSASLQDGVPAYILKDPNEVSRKERAERPLNARSLLFFHDTPWIRDYGPLQLKSPGNSVHWMDFGYTDERPLDDTVPQQLAKFMEFPIEEGGYYLEGGAIISNGRGLCAITDNSLEKALVDQEDPDEFASFSHALGCSALAVLTALTGESTGHADIIAQFYASDTVAVSAVDPDVDYEVSLELDEAVQSILEAAASIHQRVRVIRIPMYVDGEDFYSYVNGTRLRKAYLVPSFKSIPERVEREAYSIIGSALEGAKLIPVPADSMVKSGGAIHCITLGLNLPRHAPWRSEVQSAGMNALRELFSFMRKSFH